LSLIFIKSDRLDYIIQPVVNIKRSQSAYMSNTWVGIR
jgi:hypothetical protein